MITARAHDPVPAVRDRVRLETILLKLGDQGTDRLVHLVDSADL
jgi:hypothetical protein